MCLYVYLFVFFKQKTAYEMRISDWSSDVCSSDLARRRGARVLQDDLQVVGRLDQLLQALRRALQRLGVVDEGEVAVVERQEDVVAPGDGEGQVFRRYAVRGEEATIACLRHHVRSETSRVRKEWVSTCRSRRSPSPYKQNNKIQS